MKFVTSSGTLRNDTRTQSVVFCVHQGTEKMSLDVSHGRVLLFLCLTTSFGAPATGSVSVGCDTFPRMSVP